MVGYRTGHYDEEDESPRAPHEQDDVGSTQGDAGDPDGFDADEFRFDSSNFGACGARCARGHLSIGLSHAVGHVLPPTACCQARAVLRAICSRTGTPMEDVTSQP